MSLKSQVCFYESELGVSQWIRRLSRLQSTPEGESLQCYKGSQNLAEGRGWSFNYLVPSSICQGD